MLKYECKRCGYIYNPDAGDPLHDVPAGTAFEDLPEDWLCPDCSAPVKQFRRYGPPCTA